LLLPVGPVNNPWCRIPTSLTYLCYWSGLIGSWSY
jgi:hypothetical protein